MPLKIGQSTNHQAVQDDKVFFGFWVYLMTDLIMFAVLFACYAVLHDSTFGGATARQLFSLPDALTETLILLTSSFTTGLGLVALKQKNKIRTLLAFSLTFILGLSFLSLEVKEFTQLLQTGNTFQKGAFLSSFFTLVGTHGLHIFVGLVWMLILIIYTVFKGLGQSTIRKFSLLAIFWHFLDLVWIFIFTMVYLVGHI